MELAARYAKTHGPFVSEQIARDFGVAPERIRGALEDLVRQGRVLLGEFRPGGYEREWCDGEVLRQLRRRSLAALRREVEPVETAALARFLVDWQGVGGNWRGIDGLVDAIGVLEGVPLAASVLECDILAVRLADYRPADLDALCTAGDLVWIGAGAVGAVDGRIKLAFRDHAPLVLTPPSEAPSDPTQIVLLNHLLAQGACFWADLVRCVQVAAIPYDDPTVLAALWDLVWSGHITNDSLAPVRAFLKGAASSAKAKPGSAAARARPRPGRLARLGPPAATGRWSAAAPLLEPRPTSTELAHSRALQLLERYGVLNRELTLGEGAEGGFAGVYPLLKALEERGQVRRGYFVAGLGAAQFALPGAVDRLRDHRSPPEVPRSVVLAATDPAQPYGAGLAWPPSAGRPARVAGAHVVLVDGSAVAYLERNGHTLATFPAAQESPGWAATLGELVARQRLRQVELRRIDGIDAGLSPLADELRGVGFVDSYRGLLLRH